jgi:hypothetical protein
MNQAILDLENIYFTSISSTEKTRDEAVNFLKMQEEADLREANVAV